jgi:colanic acid/amylovoran biosynthesis glycosyltransferase
VQPDRLSVAFLVPQFPSVSTTFILNQITGLIDRGHDITILALGREENGSLHDDISKYRLPERTSYLPRPPANTIRRIAKALPLFCRYFPQGSRTLLRSLSVARYGKQSTSLDLFFAAASLLNGTRTFDVIHCQFGQTGNLAVLLREVGALSGKVVTTFHGYDMRLGAKQGPQIYNWLREKGDCFLSISDYNGRLLERWQFPARKIIHHPVGIQLERFPFRQPHLPSGTGRDTLRIVTVARLVQEKGLEYGIRAVAALIHRAPELKITYEIVGAGHLEQSLKALVRQFGLTDKIQFLGPLPQAQVASVMSDSHLFLLPSIAEALPVVIMEAQAIGLPVLATDVGSVAELIIDGKTGCLVPPRNETALTEKVLFLARSPHLWEEIARNSRALVESRYDVNRLNDRLVNIYYSLLR